MIFMNKMKNLKIYKTTMFLPTLENDKKKGSAILLLTPNYDSSKRLLTYPLFVNKLRFSSYYIEKDVSYYINAKKVKEVEDNTVEEGTILTERFLRWISNDTINTGDKVILFQESSASDVYLRNILYNDRLKKREDVILLYEQVKKDLSFITNTFVEMDKYKKKNLFIDLYYYNKVFFSNNTWTATKGLRLYLDFMNRLINDPKIKSNGYTKKTIFIPISDWGYNNPNLWNYKVALNPMSILYEMMMKGMSTKLKEVFGNTDILFIGRNLYFKMNLSQVEDDEMKLAATILRNFLIKVVKNEDFEDSEVDTSADYTETPDVIKANIIDKIELAKGVDLTAKMAYAHQVKTKGVPSVTKAKKEEPEEKVISKGTLNKADKETESDKKQDETEGELAKLLDQIADDSSSEEEALDAMDNDEEVKKMLLDLDSSGEDKVDISAGRAARIGELDKKLLDTKIKGRKVRDILEPKEKKEDKVTSLYVASPNEEWKHLTYMNFDKNYDIDKDIINCFRHLEFVSRPISINNIEVKDNSTSEDRVELYTVEFEDYRGKRFTVKLDIPIMVDNRFLLRGGYKSIQSQLFNMPIVKTDIDTCQIISNYMKIFVKRFGSASGRSLPITSKFVKAQRKYEGRKIKFYSGDNTRICSKYQLPIDYIDLAGSYSRIETADFIVYFNQDEIRHLYEIKEGTGVPFLYNKKTKEVEYYKDDNPNSFTYELVSVFTRYDAYTDFVDLIYKSSAASMCTYTRCRIMNTEIPLVVICAYHEGLRKTLEKAGLKYSIETTLSREDRRSGSVDWVKFNDGYLVYPSTYESSLLLNGLKSCPTENFSIGDIDNKNMYLEFLDSFGGRIKADGLDNFYDLMIDPITKEILEYYKFPTDYVSVLLYANMLLADNKFVKHTDMSSRRVRRYELIAVYTYKVLADTYAAYANQLKHNKNTVEFTIKQSAVIDRFLTDTISSEDSYINALRDIETTNSITSKGPSGLNTDRAYGLDKRTYDESMLNVVGMSTGHAANVGITRQATIDANIEGERGFVKNIKGDTSKFNTAKTLTATEALTPFGSTRDDPTRTAMTFVQTSKHLVRTEESDPLLVTNGFDEAMPYITSDRFAFKAKKDGIVEEMNDRYIMIAYDDGTKDYINITETIEHNSDGGYYVPLKLDPIDGLAVGSRVEETQIVAYDKYSFSNSVGESDNLAYNVGKLAKVAVVNTDEGFEDSGVITEKMAQKLATRIDLEFETTLDRLTTVLSMAKVGDHVEAGDPLMIWQAPFDEEEADSLVKSLGGDNVSELGKKKLNSHVTGKVTAIKIYRTVELEELSESLFKIVDAYEKPLRTLKAKLEKNHLDISQVPAHYILPPTGKLKKAQNSVVIKFYVEYMDTVGVGDKVVYFSANKAVEKNIIPLGKEPYTDFRPRESVDAFVSEVSIDKRMVTSTIIYGSLQKLMIELDRSVKDIMGIPYDDSTV